MMTALSEAEAASRVARYRVHAREAGPDVDREWT
jgi:hypothetical protein